MFVENGAIMMGGAICLHSYNTASLQRVRMLCKIVVQLNLKLSKSILRGP